MKKNWLGMGELQIDLLKEVGNIGAAHAATALSKLISKDIDMKVPHVRIVDFDALTEVVGGPEAVIVAVFLEIHGDVEGNMFFILTEDSARGLIKRLLPDLIAENGFTDMEISALSEMGNILIGSYLTSLNEFTQLNMQPSIPYMAQDMAAAILSQGVLSLSAVSDYALVIDTTFLDGEKEVEGHFFLLPNPDSLHRVFTALGVPTNENC